MRSTAPPRCTAAAHLALAALALAGTAAPAAAQQGGLTLEQVVERTLASSPVVEQARARLDASAGALLSAGGRFDLRVGGSVSGAQESAFAPLAAGETSADAVVTRTSGYTLEASRLLRSGITLQPRVSVQRAAVDGLSTAEGGAAVGLNVVVPLLRDRGGHASTAAEHAARAQHGADELGVRHAAASGVLDAVRAYWEYAAAHARLDVYRQAEERAARLLDETRALVAADERPAADLPPVLAGAASKRMARIRAEQGVAEAGRVLGLAMGLDPAAIAALPTPATPFPAGEPWAPDSAALARLVRMALASRPDLAGAALETRSALALVDGARSEARPRLDVAVGVGYTGSQRSSGFGQLVGPLYENVPGLNASLGFQYQLPVGRAEVRGSRLQRAALHRQSIALERDLGARAASGVAVASQALTRSAAELAEAEQAVSLYLSTVDNERQKNRLGASTLFDVLYAEDNLTSAMLGVVASRLGYARAFAALRYETGTLVEDQGAAPAGALLTTPP